MKFNIMNPPSPSVWLQELAKFVTEFKTRGGRGSVVASFLEEVYGIPPTHSVQAQNLGLFPQELELLCQKPFDLEFLNYLCKKYSEGGSPPTTPLEEVSPYEKALLEKLEPNAHGKLIRQWAEYYALGLIESGAKEVWVKAKREDEFSYLEELPSWSPECDYEIRDAIDFKIIDLSIPKFETVDLNSPGSRRLNLVFSNSKQASFAFSQFNKFIENEKD